jgi:hypothetical protein
VPAYVPTVVTVVYVPGTVNAVPHDCALDDEVDVGVGDGVGVGVVAPKVTTVGAIALTGTPATCAPTVALVVAEVLPL